MRLITLTILPVVSLSVLSDWMQYIVSSRNHSELAKKKKKEKVLILHRLLSIYKPLASFIVKMSSLNQRLFVFTLYLLLTEKRLVVYFFFHNA